MFTAPSRLRRSERGYMLLTLMLAVTLLAIAAVAIAPTLAFQVRRDHEEELIHRGVQYSRAVRRYFKKFQRYPTTIEELESTNNVRFLRKRYKDPITNQDFKLLHFGEVQMVMGGGIAGGAAPGTPIGNGPAGTSQPASQFSLKPSSANSGQPGSSDSGASAAAGDDSDSSASSGKDASKQTSSAGIGSSQGAGQTFGGGPILGVVSTSKAESIREFNNKNHYNQWQFIYDPGTDRGGLLNTPAQPPLQNAVPMQAGAGAGAIGAGAMGAGAMGAGGITGAPGGAGAQNPGTGTSPAPFGQQPMNSQPQPQTPAQPEQP